MPKVIELASDRAPSFRRPIEITTAILGAAAAAVLMGGFSLVMTRTGQNAFIEKLYPLLSGTANGAEPSAGSILMAARTLGAWFGITALVCVAITVITVWIARSRPERRSTGWWMLAAGLVCLLGSQLLMYPVAFLFFVSATLFALRRPDPGSLR